MRSGLLIPFLLTGWVATPGAAVAAETIAERMVQLDLRSSKLFHVPKSPQEKLFFQLGTLNHWRSYGDSSQPVSRAFNGYILFEDPYHRGLKRISFLMGSDCSHFVHRIFQMLGANYPFAKTRHFIHLAKQIQEKRDPQGYYNESAKAGQVIDLTPCEWNELGQAFKLIPLEEARAGDVLVFPKTEGRFGQHGHMGILKAPDTLLHASRSSGIAEEPVAQVRTRYSGTLAFRFARALDGASWPKSLTLERALQNTYEWSPSRCSRPAE